jgi:16S rRNA (guanine1207-N2)-methyltransferase
MTSPRLIHALDAGAVTLPDGRIAVFSPAAGTDLSGLGRDRVQVVTSFRPDHDFFAAQGYDCVRQPSSRFDAALVFVPRARDRARGLIAAAATLVSGGLLMIEGARTDGIDSILKDLRDRVQLDGGLSKAHGRILWLTGLVSFPDWRAASAPRDIGGWITVPGSFSSDAPDAGSSTLLAELPPLRGRVADLGAGWGYLSRSVLAGSREVTELHLIEADAEALDCARANVTDPRAAFHWADATRPLPGAPFDVVVTNPPFHTGRAPDPALGRAFIAAAARALTPQGTLWLVANRHLPYEAALTEAFVDVEARTGTPAFKITRASRPRRRT